MWGVESISANVYYILRHPDVTLKQLRPKLESTGACAFVQCLRPASGWHSCVVAVAVSVQDRAHPPPRFLSYVPRVGV